MRIGLHVDHEGLITHTFLYIGPTTPSSGYTLYNTPRFLVADKQVYPCSSLLYLVVVTK